MIKDPKHKIFCIGFPKTGTRSICSALEILGYKTIHYPKPLGAILGYQACGDISITVNWKFLDHIYPGSKFILTTREKGWHQSAARHFAGLQHNPYREQLFGCLKYDRKKFQTAYDKHIEDVLEHFRNRPPGSLLITTVEQGWEPLCKFLSKDIPQKPFPWLGRFKG